MTMRDFDPAELETLLVEERRRLVAGDFEGLAPLAERKQALAAAMGAPGDRLPARDLTRLSALARRNQALLAAASEGLRSAVRRLAELQNLHLGRGTYGSGGLRSTAADTTRVERRY